MSRLIHYLIILFSFFVFNGYANQIVLLRNEVFNSFAKDSGSPELNKKEIEGNYLYLNFEKTFALYKITSTIDFTQFNTIELEYYIEKGNGQILLINTNDDSINFTTLDAFSTNQNEWISKIYTLPSCSKFNGIAIKNLDSLVIRFKKIKLKNNSQINVITNLISSEFSSWSWGISDIENIDDHVYIEKIYQYSALSIHYEPDIPYYNEYCEFEIKETDLNMGFLVSTDSCGEYAFYLGDYTPLKDGEWNKYHIDMNNILENCNLNRFSFMNYKDPYQELSIKNFFVASYEDANTPLSNENIKYECEILLSMIKVFDENQQIYWEDVSENVENILYQPNRILAYDIRPGGFLSFKAPENYFSPTLIEMEVLTSHTHWTIELLDSSNNIINTVTIDDENLSMNSWTTIKKEFDREASKEDLLRSFKIYHDSKNSENFLIRYLSFHPFSPPIETSIEGDESCCEVKYCDCEVVYETIYIDEDDDISNYENEDDINKEKETDEKENNNKDKEISEKDNNSKDEEQGNENGESTETNKSNINNNETDNKNKEDNYKEIDNNEANDNTNEIDNTNKREYTDDNDNYKNGEIQKRSLLKRIGSFLNNLNI